VLTFSLLIDVNVTFEVASIKAPQWRPSQLPRVASGILFKQLPSGGGIHPVFVVCHSFGMKFVVIRVSIPASSKVKLLLLGSNGWLHCS